MIPQDPTTRYTCHSVFLVRTQGQDETFLHSSERERVTKEGVDVFIQRECGLLIVVVFDAKHDVVQHLVQQHPLCLRKH